MPSVPPSLAPNGAAPHAVVANPMRVPRLLVALLVLAPASIRAEAERGAWLQPTFVLETGFAYVAQNDGRYGADGTAYDADDVGQQANLARVSRASLELERGRHTAILLYAPLELTTTVTLERDLQFRDRRFAAGSVVDHRYLFDGYRASYLYRIIGGADGARDSLVRFELGGSLQIRNADVAFTASDGSAYANQSDIGPVFAAKARLWIVPRRGPWALLEADALSTFGLIDGVSGGIYDLGLTTGYPVGRGVELVLVARLLGGGAEVESQQIDNWANFVSFTAGARIALDRVVSGGD